MNAHRQLAPDRPEAPGRLRSFGVEHREAPGILKSTAPLSARFTLPDALRCSCHQELPHGFHTANWPANLDTFVELARDRPAPATFAETYPFFPWLIVNIPTFVKLSDEQRAVPLSPKPSHAAITQP